MKHVTLILLTTLCSFTSPTIWGQEINIIPRPQEISLGKGIFTVDEGLQIVSPIVSSHAVDALRDHIYNTTGLRPQNTQTNQADAAAIHFKLDNKLAEEAYRLAISPEEIQILAKNDTGWYYGVQSLIQLFPQLTDSTERISSFLLPTVTINDAPRFPWRAFMLDEGRFFKGMEQVKMLLDEMAHLKMNVFHWHLVDDQGWRIEIKKYPLLTEIGSKRKSSQIGPLKWDSPIQSAEPHEGFYTQEQIREIIKYAEERYITVVPEIEMPGHSGAAIAAYPWLGTAKKEIEVPIRFGVSEDVYDVSDPKVIEFLTDVLDEVIDLFPSKVIHIGGDEVKYTHWNSSETVQNYMHENGLNSSAELQVFFTNHISQYLQSKGRRMMGWNEILGQNIHEYQDEAETESSQELAKSTIVHFWRGDLERATRAAESGFEIVN